MCIVNPFLVIKFQKLTILGFSYNSFLFLVVTLAFKKAWVKKNRPGNQASKCLYAEDSTLHRKKGSRVFRLQPGCH
jgi:hypothetical protein